MGTRWLLKIFGLAPPVLALVLLLGGGSAVAANKCGCTRNESNNTCSCSKAAKCGCPGDCEPKGCEEKREAQMKKEIEAETKKAAEADRKHATVSTKSSGGSSKGAATEKKSGDDGADEGSRSAKDSSKSGGAEPAAGRKLTPAQAKQLVKLLDAYFAENPDARTRNVEEVRNQLSQSR